MSSAAPRWPSPGTPKRGEEAAVPPRVLRLRAHHIATFTPAAEEDEDIAGGSGPPSSGAPFALDAGATLQQARCAALQRCLSRELTRGARKLLAAVGDAWARGVANAPLSSAVREAFTATGERIRRVSMLRDGDDVVFATWNDLRPVMMCEDLAKARFPIA